MVFSTWITRGDLESLQYYRERVAQGVMDYSPVVAIERHIHSTIVGAHLPYACPRIQCKVSESFDGLQRYIAWTPLVDGSHKHC